MIEKKKPFAPFGKQVAIYTEVSVRIAFQCETSKESLRLSTLLNEAWEKWVSETEKKPKEKGQKMFQVFENDKPAQYPDISVHPSWNNSTFHTLEEAQIYLNDWLGPYANPKEIIPPEKISFYNGEDYVIIKEIAKSESRD